MTDEKKSAEISAEKKRAAGGADWREVPQLHAAIQIARARGMTDVANQLEAELDEILRAIGDD